MIMFGAWVAGNAAILWASGKMNADNTSDPVGASLMVLAILAAWNIGCAIFAWS